MPPLDGPEPRPPESMQSGAVRLPSGVTGCLWLTSPEGSRETDPNRAAAAAPAVPGTVAAVLGSGRGPPQPGQPLREGDGLAPWDPTPSGKLLSGPGVGLPPSSAHLVPRGRLLILMHPHP